MNVEIRRLHRGDDALVMRLANLPLRTRKGEMLGRAEGVLSRQPVLCHSRAEQGAKRRAQTLE